MKSYLVSTYWRGAMNSEPIPELIMEYPAAITRIINSYRGDPKSWLSAWNTAIDIIPNWDTSWQQVVDNTQSDIANNIFLDINRISITVIASIGESTGAPWTSCIGLLSFPEIEYLLNCNPDDILLLAKLGDHRAALLYVAALALDIIKNKPC